VVDLTAGELDDRARVVEASEVADKREHEGIVEWAGAWDAIIRSAVTPPA